MRRFRYTEPTESGEPKTVTLTEQEILAEQRIALSPTGFAYEFRDETLIDEWCQRHWAWELKDGEK